MTSHSNPKVYSTHRVINGKWEATVYILRDDRWEHSFEPLPDLRNIIDENYTLAPEKLAKLLFFNVLDCEKVELTSFSGNGIVVTMCGI